MQNHDTIVAIASAHGVSAGIGIVRISGAQALQVASLITQLHANTITPRHAFYCQFYTSNNNSPIAFDNGILLYFKSPHSFTGEDVVELQAHGGIAGLNMLVNECLSVGCRLAGNGEFSKRAFINGKLDLAQAEGIIDLINAESSQAVIAAFNSLQGAFSDYINAINSAMIDLRIFVEATLDFPEEDIELIKEAQIHTKLKSIQQQLKQLLKDSEQGIMLNNGVNLMIIGMPNVGKSSLLNALANEEVAIVTDIAGTTRDIIRQKIIIQGIAFNLIDSAGIRDTNDKVEQIGIKKTLDTLNTNIHVCLLLTAVNDHYACNATNSISDLLKLVPPHALPIIIHNKIDLLDKPISYKFIDNIAHVYISAKFNLGIDLLKCVILHAVGFAKEDACLNAYNISNNYTDNNNTSGKDKYNYTNNHTLLSSSKQPNIIEKSSLFTARLRHVNSIQQAIEHIDYAFNNWHNLEIVAHMLQCTHDCLGEVVGNFSNDDLLGSIFSKFCIGK